MRAMTTAYVVLIVAASDASPPAGCRFRLPKASTRMQC